MKKNTLLGILSFGTLTATILATMFSNGLNIRALAEGELERSYTVTISTANNLKKTGTANYFGFQLHDENEYGSLNGQWDLLKLNPTGYSDCAFSWTRPGSDRFFYIPVVSYSEVRTIDGVSRNMRGFPNATRITTIYKESSEGLNLSVSNTGWKTLPKTKAGDLITIVSERDTTLGSSTNFDWTLRDEGTVYIKRIIIEYTCSQ